MEIKNFTENKAVFKLIRADIDSALAEVSKKYGISLKGGAISYSDYEFKMKLTASIESKESKEVETEKSKRNWEDVCNMLPEMKDKKDWFGKKIQSKGKVLKVVGYSWNKPKNPIELEDDSGRSFKAPVGFLRDYLIVGA